MKITNDQPIPFRVTLTDVETAAFLQDLQDRFGPSLPAGLLSGRTFTSIQFTFTNPATGNQTGSGSLQLATVAVPLAPTASATPTVAKAGVGSVLPATQPPKAS
jgi:hypothetical protein